MTTIIGTKELAEINQKVVQDGEVLSQVKLKDGSRVQTGTVATMLHNINFIIITIIIRIFNTNKINENFTLVIFL